MLFLLLIILAGHHSPNNLYARQSDPEPKTTHAWINLGFGLSMNEKLSGVGLLVNAQFDSNIGLFGIRYFIAGDHSVHNQFSEYIDDLSEWAVTYGTSHNYGILNLSASAGLGVLTGEERTMNASSSFRVVSFPVQASMILRPVPVIGAGFILSASANSFEPIYSAQFVLQLGRLR